MGWSKELLKYAFAKLQNRVYLHGSKSRILHNFTLVDVGGFWDLLGKMWGFFLFYID